MMNSPNNTLTLQLVVLLFLPVVALMVYIHFEIKKMHAEQEATRSAIVSLEEKLTGGMDAGGAAGIYEAGSDIEGTDEELMVQ